MRQSPKHFVRSKGPQNINNIIRWDVVLDHRKVYFWSGGLPLVTVFTCRPPLFFSSVMFVANAEILGIHFSGVFVENAIDTLNMSCCLCPTPNVFLNNSGSGFVDSV